jgi:hypothetical protein
LERIPILSAVISQVLFIFYCNGCLLIPCSGDRIWSGITAAGCHHVNYFNSPNQSKHYGEFYCKALKVVDVNVLSFASHVQALLVLYLCDRLAQQRQEEWFCKLWTGLTGAHWRWTLTHAGYAVSNNNMGVEVNWRDMKTLVPQSATLVTFTGALVKNIRDLCIEHEDFLCQQGQLNLFLSVPKQLKSIYDLMQAVHSKTSSCSVIAGKRLVISSSASPKLFMLLER